MKVVEITFSPTGGTDKVAAIIGGQWSAESTRIDLSDPRVDFAGCTIDSADQVLISMPSFGGRAPAVAIERLKQIKGNGARCTLVCVYGNRAYEDTLAEMEDAAKECGFQVVAAIAAVAEHSILPQYASGRPDAADAAQLRQFADEIAGRTEAAHSIPGNRPYKKAGGAGLVPKPTKEGVRPQLPRTGHRRRQRRCRLRRVHILHALRKALPPQRPQGQQRHGIRGSSGAQKGLLGQEG
ncbi:MAG: flavodoxin family protein, partial [Candidatus Fimadaptatus sp.]